MQRREECSPLDCGICNVLDLVCPDPPRILNWLPKNSCNVSLQEPFIQYFEILEPILVRVLVSY